MRIVSYNILNGGEGRADPLAEVIEAQWPDVVALIEADVKSVVERIGQRLSMDFVIAEGEQHACALLSRWPITQSMNHSKAGAGRKRAFLEAHVQDPNGVEWPIGVVHLSAGALEADEQVRMGEIGVVLDRMRGHRTANRAHLLCGDFNCNAAYQRIDPMRCKEKTRDAWEKNGGRLPGDVVNALRAAGYTDAYHLLHDETGEMVGSFSTQQPGQRVDYVFVHGVPTARITEAGVEQDRLAKYASDHFPIVVEIDHSR